jgi:type II secretory pathway pseudopilin PulG
MSAKNTKHNLQSRARRGFTIVEIITVLFVVSVGLIGVLSLIIKNIQSQTFNKQNLIAYQLAQEGIELTREVRDTNWKLGLDFNDSLTDGYYSLDYNNLTPTPVSEGNPPPLYLNGGYYSHTPSAPNATSTGFKRSIRIETLDPPTAMRVTCTVAWAIRDIPYAYNLETILYDWR